MERAQDIEIRHLQALRAVADEGSFLGAADVLGYSQAAISQQIAGLERVIGQRVLDRPGGPRPATLTPAGRLVLTHGQRILDRLASLREDLRHLEAGTGGRVVCGTFESVTVRLIPDLVAAMRREMPGVQISLYESDDHVDLLEAVAVGDVDITFMSSPGADDRVTLIPLGRDPYVVLTPATAVGGSGPYRIGDLSGVPLIGQKESDYQAHVDDALRAHGVSTQYAFRTNDNGGVQAMVRAGLGVAVMPLLTVDTGDPGIRVRKLVPAIEPRTISVGLRAEGARLPAAERVAELAKAVARQHLARA